MNEIIGYEIEKSRIEEIADVFKNKEKYQQKGIAIPKGLMLTGPAGVGKTMFAKYLAKISGATLFVFSPSTDENANLENAAKLKKLYEVAKHHTPAIVFVDELDEYMPDDYFRTDRNSDFLATILQALDGDGYEGIMFVGACIHISSIPQQVIRSGRVDESIVLSRPNLETRGKMISYYLSKIHIGYSFDVSKLANKTSGFVGADIKNLVNITCRSAIQKNKSDLSIDDFIEPIYTIRHKDIKRENDDSEKYKVAVHEIGHLIVGRILLEQSFDVTIDSYDYIKGMIVSLDDDNDTIVDNKENFIYEIATSLGGKAAEEICFGYTTTGCYSDIKKALKIIDCMLQCGMCGFGYIDLALTDERTDWSDKHTKKVEKKTIQIMNKCYKLAKRIIKQNLPVVKEFVGLLIDKTVIVAEESNTLFEKYGI